MATGGTGAMRASLRPLSPSVPTLGSGSGGRLRLLSDGQGRASLSGLPDVGALARRAASRSGGGQRLATASEPDGLLVPCAAKQPASVSASAGRSSSSISGVGVGGLRPLSAELGLSPLGFSGPGGGCCCCWVVLGREVEPQRLLDQPRLQTIRPLMVTSVTVVTVIVIEAVSVTVTVTVSVSVISAGTLSVSALVIPVMSVAVVTVTLVMIVMALVPGVVLWRCYVRLCVCFWSALLSGLGGLLGGESLNTHILAKTCLFE